MNVITPQQVTDHAAERRRELRATLSAEHARRAARSPDRGRLVRRLRQLNRTVRPDVSGAATVSGGARMSHLSNSAAASSLLAATIGVFAGLTSIAGPMTASATHVPPPCNGYDAYPACQGSPLLSLVCGALRAGASHPSDGSDIIVDVDGDRLTDANDQYLLDMAQEIATRACRPDRDDAEPADQDIITHRCGGGPIQPCAV